MSALMQESLATRFDRDGFAVLDSLTTAEDIARVRSLLDPLFDSFNSLGERAFDLAGPLAAGEAPRSPEVNETAVLEPKLRETLTYERCRDVARHLLGVPVGYQFDHAIYKMPNNQTATAWHQDEAYNKEPIPLRSVHFWIPLQPATDRERLHVVHARLSPRRPPARMSVAQPARRRRHAVRSKSLDASGAVACPLRGRLRHHPPAPDAALHRPEPVGNQHRRAWILHFGAYGKMRHLLHPKSMWPRPLRGWIPHGNQALDLASFARSSIRAYRSSPTRLRQRFAAARLP
jgi:hypothetical protein